MEKSSNTDGQNIFNKNINKERWVESDLQLGCYRMRISLLFDEQELNCSSNSVPQTFFFSSQMSRLIYFNEFLTKERDQYSSATAPNPFRHCLNFSLLWLCCLLTLCQVTVKENVLVLFKIAKFPCSGNSIIWHTCDVGILGDL